MQQTHQQRDKPKLNTIKSEVYEDDDDVYRAGAHYNRVPLVKEVLIQSQSAD